MTGSEAQGHPRDRLVELIASPATAADSDLLAHLERCEPCRAELEILRALASAAEPAELSDLERRAAYAAFRARSGAGGPAPSGFGRAARSLTLIAATAILLLAGVWLGRATRAGSTAWNPEAAMAGFEADLRDLDASAAQVRLVLGDVADPQMDSGTERPEWEELGEADLDRLRIPWEND